MDNQGVEIRPAASVRGLVSGAWKAVLGTIDRLTGHPYTSLVAIATEPDGTPLLLLSRLALHTKNLEHDSRASLLIDGAGAGNNALAGERVTLIGAAAPTSSATARDRFLARHPPAASYVDFADFAFWRLEIARAHFVGGFGRIVELARHDVLVSAGDAEALIAAERELVSDWNERCGDTLRFIATRLGDGTAGPWRLIGIDPDGLDMALEDRALRLWFGGRVRTPDEARQAFAALEATAREVDSSRL